MLFIVTRTDLLNSIAILYYMSGTDVKSLAKQEESFIKVDCSREYYLAPVGVVCVHTTDSSVLTPSSFVQHLLSL